MVEPTELESAAFTNIGDVLNWAGLGGDVADPVKEAGSILALFGATPRPSQSFGSVVIRRLLLD